MADEAAKKTRVSSTAKSEALRKAAQMPNLSDAERAVLISMAEAAEKAIGEAALAAQQRMADALRGLEATFFKVGDDSYRIQGSWTNAKGEAKDLLPRVKADGTFSAMSILVLAAVAEELSEAADEIRAQAEKFDSGT